MSESRPVGRVIGVNVRDDELVVRCFGSADASLLHEVLSVARPEPVGEPVAIAWLEVRQNREVKVRLSDTQKAEAIYQALLHGDGGDVSLPLYAAPPDAPEAREPERGTCVRCGGSGLEPGLAPGSATQCQECFGSGTHMFVPTGTTNRPTERLGPRTLDEEVARWDASVEQIHRELAGEVPPPSAAGEEEKDG